MRVTKGIFALLLTFSFAGFAHAGTMITCDSAASAMKRYYDDPCEGITDAAEACFDDLNTEFVKHEKAKEPSKAIEELATSYTKAIATLRDDYSAELGKIGGSCFDHGGELEIWIKEMKQDLSVLEKIRGR